jgi:RNA polymerase sigma-70 factor (ECF subfamily)
MRVPVTVGSRRVSAVQASARDSALDHLVERCSARGYRIARDLLGDASAAEDAVQEALAAAMDGLSRLREPAALEGWFYRVLTNHCMRTLRRRRWLSLWIGRSAAAEADDDGHAPSPAAALAAARESARLVAAVNRLPPMQKAAVVLRYGHERSVDEVGALLGVSPKTIKTHLVRGLRALRTALEESP